MSKPLRLIRQAARTAEFRCPLCHSVHAGYIFGTEDFRIYRCGGCGLIFKEIQPERGGLEPPPTRPPKTLVDDNHNAAQLAAIAEARIDGPVLVVANPDAKLVPLLRRGGTEVGRLAAEDDFEPGDWGETYRAAIVSNALMRVANPCATLTKIRKHLAPGAPFVLSVPLLDSYQARRMGRNWQEWRPENLWYFTRESLNLLLLSSGFEQVWFQNERRGTSVVTARAALPRPSCTVSIIVPVFNERPTFQAMMDALLEKQLQGMRKEIVIVESNSTDGSREIAKSYALHPEVKLVLQAAPQGKGNAVRAGLEMATGDIIMIQDADLEYDLDDYDGLIAPVADWQSMFILGSRHQGGWKMRKFNDAPITASVFNLGHWFFKSLINVVLNTKMTDPFTMFKVFRRDALYGLDLRCNRFDFDIELVIKLVRKGYVPLELPVNYVARSFAEGKKVSMTRDGLTWVWTILQARFSPLGNGRQGTAQL